MKRTITSTNPANTGQTEPSTTVAAGPQCVETNESGTHILDMKNDTSAAFSGYAIGGATLPREAPKKMDEAAATASPLNTNPAGEPRLIDHDDDNRSTEAVDPEKIDIFRSQRDDAKSTKPNNKNADELMKEHVGEIPKAAKKFSLASLKSKSVEAVPKSSTKPGTVTVAKPHDDTFVRTSAKSEECAAFDFIELKTDKKLYLVTPDVVEEIHALNEDRAQLMIKTVKKRLIYSVTRLGDLFLWPITIMDGDNDWVDSANICAEAARDNWIRVVSNLAAGRYDYVTSPSTTEPKWSAMTYEDAVLKAFGGKVIDRMGHDVIQQLLGVD